MNALQKRSANLMLEYITNDPLKRLPAMLELAEKFYRNGKNTSAIKRVREALSNKKVSWYYSFLEKLLVAVDTNATRKLLESVELPL